jgi:hypothetical protein
VPIIILIPGLICVLSLLATSPQRTFLNVYLPVFMLLPTYYFWKVATLPPVDFSEAVLIPLGIAMLFVDGRRWHFTRSDLWMVLFLFSSWYADHIALKESVATFELFASLSTALVPYMAGKLLIEQYDARIPTIKRILFLLFLCSIVSAYEYRMGRNPFSLMLARFFPGEIFAWKTQIRWGFGRVSGPFAQSELAGIIWGAGLILALYIGYLKLWEKKFAHLEWLPFKKSTIVTGTLAFTLLMTQARGPWLGFLVALPIALVGRAKRVVRTAILVAVLGITFGSLGYIALKYYTAGPATSDEQETAQYRQLLIANYVPVIEQGGIFGWGQDFPRVGPQGSIDNEYLYVSLIQGYLGLAAFCLLALEAMYDSLKLGLFSGRGEDRSFGFSMLGILVGIMVILGTVYLGNQPYQLFFLFVGWSQAQRMWLGKVREPEPAFEAVYT